MGFSKQTFQFLTGLEANNSKDWFEDNRKAYETHWKDAALDFIAAVSDRMAALDPALRAEPKLNKSLRRINRDVRFSKDKSPYNARLHMVFWAGHHPNRSPATPSDAVNFASCNQTEPVRLNTYTEPLPSSSNEPTTIVSPLTSTENPKKSPAAPSAAAILACCSQFPPERTKI